MAENSRSAVQTFLDWRDDIAKGMGWLQKQNQPTPHGKTALEPYAFLRKGTTTKNTATVSGGKAPKKTTRKRATGK